jgi:hypothetical protein
VFFVREAPTANPAYVAQVTRQGAKRLRAEVREIELSNSAFSCSGGKLLSTVRACGRFGPILLKNSKIVGRLPVIKKSASQNHPELTISLEVRGEVPQGMRAKLT